MNELRLSQSYYEQSIHNINYIIIIIERRFQFKLNLKFFLVKVQEQDREVQKYII